MLTEFAFTPSVFDEDAHEDKEAWSDQLRELATAMFPRTSAWPVIVSDLYAGSWSSHILPYVKRISDHRARKHCQELLKNMQRMLVPRPEYGDWPDEDDAKWCKEAITAHLVEPIERIVSVQNTKDTSLDEFSIVRTIDEVEDSGFWQGVESDASPRMVIDVQVDLLRKLCLHSQWVAFINPYGFGNELDFTVQLLNRTLNCKSGFGGLHFELHAQEPDVSDATERVTRQKRVTHHMARKIQPMLSDNDKVDLYFWPKLLDRILIAGNYTKESRWKLPKISALGRQHESCCTQQRP